MNPNSIRHDHREVIENAIMGQARTQQKRIGPSEIGISCTRCLTLKLGGAKEQRDAAWLPWIGTAVHSQLEAAFTAQNKWYIAAGGAPRYLTECRVSIGEIGGIEITGSSDLLDTFDAQVVDFKIVGKSTLDSVKRGGPTPVYRVQGHCYGYGHVRAERKIETVSILYLPRNSPNLSDAYFWSEPYNEAIAVSAIKRADNIANSINVSGLDEVLANTTPHIGDYSCNHYPSDVGTWQQSDKGARNFDDLAGLIIPTLKI